jgi:hypothetical protein
MMLVRAPQRPSPPVTYKDESQTEAWDDINDFPMLGLLN